jgi:rhamnosyltransferase
MADEILASIIIPTFNGSEYMQETLEAIFNQDTDFAFEVIIIDSGSTDSTCEIASKFPVRLMRIPKEEFNHGETRNLGAEKSKGKFLVYLTQDATPADSNWLKEMVKSFDVDDKIANVLGKQIPRQNCSPTIKRNIEQTFKMIGNGNDEPTLYFIKKGKDGLEEYEKKKDVMRFNSDVNAAYRKEFWEKIRFRNISYCEDQAIGQDLLEGGYKRFYNPKAAVFHSHAYAVKDFLRRYFDEYRGYNIAFGYVDSITPISLFPHTFFGWLQDVKYISKQSEYKLRKKISWSIQALFMNFFQRLGAYLGARHGKLPAWLKKAISLESN